NLKTSEARQLQSLETSEVESVPEAEHVQSLDYQSNPIDWSIMSQPLQ
ncbi:hypothetical protein A2U01_0064422, partial [Trifolium medium]|nr:hypothetical protein [Trifolium medium]